MEAKRLNIRDCNGQQSFVSGRGVGLIVLAVKRDNGFCRPIVVAVPADFRLDRVGIAATVTRPSYFNLAHLDSATSDAHKETGKANDSGLGGSVGTLFRWSFDPWAGEVAQLDEGLISDRPDFTEASSVVGLGVLQLETGYAYTMDKNGTTRTIAHSYPEALFRYGVIANWLEFRLGTNYAEIDTNGVKSAGGDDLYLGFKIGLTPQEGWRPEMAMVPQMTVPSGGRSVTSGEVLPGVNWLYGWDLTDNISTAGSTQFNRALDGTTGESYTEWAQSWTVGYSLTKKLGAYTEYFGFFPAGADTAVPQHYANGGFTFSITDNLQWDIRAGVGLNDAADDYFTGSGLVFRFR